MVKEIKNHRKLCDKATPHHITSIQAASKKWTMPSRNWKAAMNRFMIEFEEHSTVHILVHQIQES
jgi:transposase-like protein